MNLTPEIRQETVMLLDPAGRDLIFKHSRTLSAWDGLKPIAAAGIIPYYPNIRAVGWAVFAPEARHHMTGIVRRALKFIKEDPARRVEMHITEGFDAGHKWAKMLGFKCETPEGMEAFSGIGKKQYMYSKVKTWD